MGRQRKGEKHGEGRKFDGKGLADRQVGQDGGACLPREWGPGEAGRGSGDLESLSL